MESDWAAPVFWLFLACSAGFCLESPRGWRTLAHWLEKGCISFLGSCGHVEDHSGRDLVIVGGMDQFSADEGHSVWLPVLLFLPLYLTYVNWNSHFEGNQQKPVRSHAVQECQPSTVASCGRAGEKNCSVLGGCALCLSGWRLPRRPHPSSQAEPCLRPCPLPWAKLPFCFSEVEVDLLLFCSKPQTWSKDGQYPGLRSAGVSG